MRYAEDHRLDRGETLALARRALEAWIKAGPEVLHLTRPLTEADPARMENHNGRPEVQAARQVGVGSEVRFSRTLDERSVYVAQLLDPRDPNGTVVRVSYPQHTWAELGAPTWAIVGGGVGAALLAVAVFWGILQRQWITPTRLLAHAAEGMASRGSGMLPSFADIFRNNCYKNGLLPVVLLESQVDRLFDAVKAFPGFRLTIDLERQTVAAMDGSMTFSFDVEPFRKHCLINGLDEIGLTLQHADEIREFEAKRLHEQPWLV